MDVNGVNHKLSRAMVKFGEGLLIWIPDIAAKGRYMPRRRAHAALAALGSVKSAEETSARR